MSDPDIDFPTVTPTTKENVVSHSGVHNQEFAAIIALAGISADHETRIADLEASGGPLSLYESETELLSAGGETAISLGAVPLSGVYDLFDDGLRLRSSLQMMAGTLITLGTPATAAHYYVVRYRTETASPPAAMWDSADIYWTSVKVLLHFDGTNGATTIVDETGRAWTGHNSAALTTSTPKFGTASGAFVGTNGSAGSTYWDTPSASSLDLGTAPFTVEWWQWWTNTTGTQIGFDRGYTGSGGLVVQAGSAGEYGVYISNVLVGTEGSGPSTGAWIHYALTRDGSNNVTLWRDGTATVTGTSSASIGGAYTLAVGARYDGFYGINGKIDEFRYTPGICRYTTTFTPPAAAFPNQ